jgi:hypothetical protein
MKSVKVKRDDLLKRIDENRAQHKSVVEEALANYRIEVIKELDAMLDEAKKGKKIRRQVRLVEPQDHTSDYDRVIDMLKMSTEDVIELDGQSFARYVRDEWEWFGQFANSNISYTRSAQSARYLTRSGDDEADY